MVPWAAIGFSRLWGAVFGLALSRDNGKLAALSGAWMLLTLVLTALLHRQQTHLRNLAETDSLTGLMNHHGFQQALRSELQPGASLTTGRLIGYEALARVPRRAGAPALDLVRAGQCLRAGT